MLKLRRFLSIELLPSCLSHFPEIIFDMLKAKTTKAPCLGMQNEIRPRKINRQKLANRMKT